MIIGVGRVQKLGKYNRQKYIVTNRPLNTNLPNSNSHDKYNENINVWSKEPITADIYYRPSNDKNDALCLFLEYLLHLEVDNNHILSLFLLSMLGYFSLWCVWRCVWYCMIPFGANLDKTTDNREWGNVGKYTK